MRPEYSVIGKLVLSCSPPFKADREQPQFAVVMNLFKEGLPAQSW